MRNRKIHWTVLAAIAYASSQGLAYANPVVLNFEGVGNQANVNDFYNGGTDSQGHSGVNYGVNFTPNSLGLITGNYINNPTSPTVLFFLSGSAATMNVAAGFSSGFSFFYSSSVASTLKVWDGLGSSGNLLASIDLSAQNDSGCATSGYAYCNWTAIGVSFAGVARSVDFSGTADRIGFDNITLGSQTPGGATIDTVNGDLSPFLFSTKSTAYLQPALTFDGGTLQYSADTLTNKNALINTPGGTVDSNGFSVTISGIISGPGYFKKIGDGVLILSGANTYTGATTISGGTLALSGAGSIARSSIVVVDGVFDLSATSSGTSIQTLSGSGQVNLGAKTLSLTNAASPFSGVIGGGGGLTLVGGTATLTGANTYTGGTDIHAGATLNLGNGGISGSIVGNVTDNGSLIFKRSDAVDFGGAITGSGRLIQAGGGLLNLTGDSRLGGGVFVQNGSLSVNGTLASAVDVDAGASLGGAGHITGPVTVNGTLAPGNSPGTLGVTGPVTLNAGSTYQEEIDGTGTGNGAGNYDRLLLDGADGHFTAGGTLNPVLRGIGGDASNSFTPAIGDRFRIVSAQGGVQGRFAQVNQPAAGLAAGTRLDVFYNGDGIDLFATPSSYANHVSLRGGNDNARSVGQSLDGMRRLDDANVATASQNQLRYALAGLRSTQIPAFATLLSGEIHGAMAAAAPEPARWLQSALARQLSASPGSLEQAGLRAGDNLWFDFNASQGRSDSGSAASGYSASRYQFAIGGDILHSQSNRLGLGVTYASLSVSPASGAGSLEETAPFIYGQYALGKTQPVIVDGLFSYGFNTWQTQRADPLRRFSALKTNAAGHSAALGFGLRSPFAFGAVKVEPFVRVLWQSSSRGGVGEGVASPAALNLPSYGLSGTRLLVGAAVGSEQNDPLATSFTYRASVAFGEDFGDLVYPTVRASLAGLGFQINSPQVGREFAQINLSATYQVADSAYVYAGLNGEARENRLDGGVNAGFNLKF